MLVQGTLHRKLVRIGPIVVAIRVGILWYLFARHAIGNETIDEVPLVLMLMPEGLLFPRNWSWTPARLMEATIVFTISSIFITAIALAALRVAASAWRSKAF
jgi:hypothetical protein